MANVPHLRPDQKVAVLNRTDPAKMNAAQRSRLQQLLKNPNTRSLVASRLLTPQQRQSRQRQTQQRQKKAKQTQQQSQLNKPVVPGSSVTNRALQNQTQAASTLRFGPQQSELTKNLAAATTSAKDFGGSGGFYDQYLAELRQHQANTQQIGQLTNAALTNMVGQVGTLGAQTQQDVQAQQAQTNVPGAQPSAQNFQDSGNASAIRQALTGSFGAMLAGQGAGASRYADTLAHVVGPTQKLAGQAQQAGTVRQGRQSLAELAGQQGAFKQQFQEEFKQGEAKNVLAARIAGVNSQQAQQKIKQEQQKINIAAALAGSTVQKNASSTPEAKEAAKYGYTVHRWRLLGPNGRARVKSQQARQTARDKRAGAPAPTPAVITSGVFAGYTKQQVARMSTGEKNRLKTDYSKTTAATKAKAKKGKGPKWQTPAASGAAMTQLAGLKGMASDARAGNPFVKGHAKQTPLDRHAAAAKILQFAGQKLKDPILVTAALDAVYDSHLSRATVRKLIAAGYKPSQVASTLGVPTAANYSTIPASKI